MRVSIRHGAVVKCDVPNCKESYTTYSIVTLARTQAGGGRVGKTQARHDAGLGELRPRLVEAQTDRRVPAAHSAAGDGGR